MPSFYSAALMVNAVTLVMALGFLMIILWHDRYKIQNQFFAMFLFAVTLWSTGSLLSVSFVVLGQGVAFERVAVNMMQIGFSAASLSLYAVTASSVSVHTSRFRLIVLVGLAALLIYQFMIASTSQFMDYSLSNLNTTFRLHAIIFVIFNGTAIQLLWRYRARIPHLSLRLGLVTFTIGQGISLMNPTLQTLTLSIMVSSGAVVLLGIAFLHQKIILPLRERNSQVEAMHSMSLAITSQITVESALVQIAEQAGQWLKADGVAIFLKELDRIRLAAVYGFPEQFKGIVLPPHEGVAGAVIDTKRPIRLGNYSQDWHKLSDLPLSTETFGSVACVPLISGKDAIGALMVVSGRHGRTFGAEDVYLLEMLGVQVTIAIIHGELFNSQNLLTQQIEQARNQFETLLASTENPVIAVNRKLELIFANAAAERLFPPLKYISQPITEILPADVLPKSYLQTYRQIRHSRTFSYEVVIEESVYVTHLTSLGYPGDDDGIEGWVAVLNDVTQLKEYDRLKSEMVRMTSHDLKNPLQAAMAHVDLLSDALENAPDAELMHSTKVIEKQLNRMYRIIGGVLDMERIRTGKKAFQTCRPDHVLRNVIADMTEMASNKQIALTAQIPNELPLLSGDSGQLERAISNLVENAIKFTPAQGEVRLGVYLDGNYVIFEVHDNGIGIPQEDQTRVFESFFRANQKGAEHISGTGLGLHLVKTVVENHEGRVWLESAEGRGTAFFVSIPAMLDGMMTTDTS